MSVILVNAEAGRIPLPAGVVHCSVSSPPYYSLRAYQGDQARDWPEVSYSPMPGLPKMTIEPMRCALGHEPTPEAFIGHLVACYREVWRVSREDSAHWLVMGDSYAGSGPRGGGKGFEHNQGKKQKAPDKEIGLKPGDLMLIPHRLALALQADTIKDSASIAGGEIGAAWLAGVIDCDGALGIRKQERKDKGWNPSYSLYMSVNLTDIGIVQECVRVTGRGKVREETWNPPGPDNRGIVSNRQRFVWRLDGAFIEVLQSIYPYLRAKRKQALILYNLHLMNQITKGRKLQRQELLDKKEWLYQAVKKCNQREEIDLPDWVQDIPRYTGKPRWTVRNDVIWHKVAPMPESVQGTHWQRCRVKVADCQKSGNRKSETFIEVSGDPHKGRNPDNSRMGLNAQYTDCPGCPRCQATGGYVLRRGSWRHTRAHETVLHLSKGMNYWSDQEAVREAANYPTDDRKPYAPGQVDNRGNGHDRGGGAHTGRDSSGRNPRSVLTPKPESYGGQHYAVYPPSLIRPLIKSSCPRQCCPVCGAGWAAVVERGESDWDERKAKGATGGTLELGHNSTHGNGTNHTLGQRKSNLFGYRPTCDCYTGFPEDEWLYFPGIVLDPFVGSGTTLIVAHEEGMHGIGLDLSYDYLHDQARERLGLNAWAAWHEGGDGEKVANLEKLPLFEGVG